MNKPKIQGTRAETRVVELHRARGVSARRLAEGGAKDEGDVEIIIWDPYHGIQHHGEIQGHVSRVVAEVKDRERLSVQEALEKAVTKSGTHRTALFWSQPIKGMLRRRRRRCVVISEAFWFELIGAREPAPIQAQEEG